MTALGPADDRFHPAPDTDPTWTETAWFGFAVPDRGLAGTVYPLFRPNLGICSLSVYVWDPHAHAPWAVPYARSLWHLPWPDGDLDDLALGGLRYRALEPLSKYQVRYADGDRLELDLEYEGLMPPWPAGMGAGRGHLDQPCRVSGRVVLHGETIHVDAYEMRDRSWSPRDDLRTTRASYSYGIAGPDAHFLAQGMGPADQNRIVAGWLCQDGVVAPLVMGARRVVERDAGGSPLRLEIEAEDANGRRLEASGHTRSRLANPATPGMFAWMSLTEWSFGDAHMYGEDQDVWSPDKLGLPVRD